MNVTRIFCDANNFCQRFIPDWKKAQLEGEEKTPTRVSPRSICESEIITLVVCYYISVYRTFKWFYQRHAQKYLSPYFPELQTFY